MTRLITVAFLVSICALSSAEMRSSQPPSSGGSGADVNLSNLESPTAINQSLIPNADAAFNVGDAAAAFDIGYFYSLSAPDGVNLMSLDGSVSVESDTEINLQTPGSGDSVKVNSNTGLWLLGNGVSTAAPLRLYEGDNTSYAGIKAPDSLSATYTLTLPADDGASGEFLQTNGSGVLTWAASSGANTTLSNLGTTSINASLLPQNLSLSLGGASNRWSDFFTEQIRIYSGANGYAIISTDATTPGGTAAGVAYRILDPSKTAAFYTADDGTANATATAASLIETGNKTAGTGRSGAVVLRTGTSSGGKRGEITANSGLLNVSSAVVVVKVTADPCADTVLYPEGAIFYNDTSDYYCFCNAASADVQMHSPATACF